MKLRPLADRVIVKRVEQETKTASGIVIPDNAAEKPDQGEVLSVGPGKRNERGDIVSMNVKAGDRVLFHTRFGSRAISNASSNLCPGALSKCSHQISWAGRDLSQVATLSPALSL